MLGENSISRMPRMRWIWEYCMPAFTCAGGGSEEGQADLEQSLHVADVLLVDDEQDHVVVGLDHHGIMGNQYLLLADHGANSGARRQLDIADGLADDLG